MYQSETATPSDPVSHATPLRIARSAGDWVSFQLHREALERFVPRGSRVLDESLDELESNRARARARGFAGSIEGWAQRDVFSLGAFPDAAFDIVVAYGAALSHALDRRDRALSECMRVLRPRGILVLDVLSLWGSMRKNLPQLLARDLVQNRAIIRSGNAPESVLGSEHRAPERSSQVPLSQPRPPHEQLAQERADRQPALPIEQQPPQAEASGGAPAPERKLEVPSLVAPVAPAASSFEAVPTAAVPTTVPAAAVPFEPVRSDAIAPEPPLRERHCHLFRAAELEAFLRRAGLEILSLSASSALSTGVEMPMTADPGTWSALLEYERAACVERGYLDSGQHLIAIARR